MVKVERISENHFEIMLDVDEVEAFEQIAALDKMTVAQFLRFLLGIGIEIFKLTIN